MHYDGVMEKAKKDEELLSCELFLEKWGNTGISSYKLIYNELKAKIPPTFRRDLEKQSVRFDLSCTGAKNLH